MNLPPGVEPRLVGPELLGNMTPAAPPAVLPAVAERPEADEWLHEQALRPFLEETRAERVAEVQRISEHVELSLTELLAKRRCGSRPRQRSQRAGHHRRRRAAGPSRKPPRRTASSRRRRRRDELERQSSVTLQGVERMTTALALPHPEREAPEIGNLRPRRRH